MEELSDIEEINYDGEKIAVSDYEIIRNADHHAVRFSDVWDLRKFEVPLQGYNEQSGEYWAIMWDQIVEI